MTTAELNTTLLAASLLLLLAVAAVRLSARAGLPTLLLYLGIGLMLGESGLGIDFEDADLTQTVGLVLLAVILAEGGLTTRWQVIRPVLGLATALATAGVAVSVAVTAGVAYLAFDVDARTALLIGAVVSSTDAAAVFSVLRRLPLRRRLSATLEAESGLNDPLVIILVTIVVAEDWADTNPALALGQVVYQLVAGVLVGVAVARLGEVLQRRSALPSAGLYPIATVAVTFLAFAVAGVAGASSFAAVYVAGLWLGNSSLPHRGATLGFIEALAWLAQIGLFVLLGLLASPNRLPDAILPALVVGGGLLLLARPLSVALTATPFRVPWQEQVFLSWAGLRGAVPIVLATIPISAGLPAATRVFDVVFVLVVVFTLVQAPTLPPLARRLGVTAPAQPDEAGVDAAPLEDIGADLLQFHVRDGSQLQGLSLLDLRLPPPAVVSLVVREGRTIVPDGRTVLRRGDHLLLVVPRASRAAAERRLRSADAGGRLADWHGSEGEHRAGYGEGDGPARPGR